MEVSAYTDDSLQAIMQREVDYLESIDPLTIALFQNDYNPAPGIELTDLEEADFPGYSATPLAGTWDSAVVSSNVASSTQSDATQFTADSTDFDGQTIYGYYLLIDGDLYFASRFDNPRTIYPYDKLDVTAVIRRGNWPAI